MPDTRTGTALLETARAFRPRIIAQRERIEASRRLPEDLARELAGPDFSVSPCRGPMAGSICLRRRCSKSSKSWPRADASVAWCVWNGNTHWTAAQLAPEAARAVYANPDVITANSTRASGRAQVVADGYHMNGRWSLVSGCELAAWMVLLCIVHEDGKPRLTPEGAPESSFMLLPAASCEIIDTWTAGGLRGTGSHDVVVKDVFVPSPYGSAFADPHVLPEPRYRIPPFSRVIPGLGAMALGIARTAIATLTELAVDKQLQRSNQILRENHGAQIRVSQAESLMRSARLYLFDSLQSLWRVVTETGKASMESRAQVRLAASHAVASAVEAVDLMYTAAGASALYTSSPLERAFRDVHAITQHIGVHPRVLETTGRVLLGLEPDTPLL